MSEPSPLTVEEWHAFLTEYSREVLTSKDQERDRALPDGGFITVPRFTPEVLEGGWLGSAPCSEADVRAVEARLGRSLPPSFRNFYLVSNGWSDAGRYGEDVWRIQDIEWLRDSDFSDLIEAWEDALSEESFEVLRVGLLVGYADGGAGDYWLLAPPEPGDQSEWTAYQWGAGSGSSPEPFESFGALMAAVREAVREED
ncbi:MAG: hypothetical protein QOE51_2905 [Actinoplanes sp.]|jgi:hypothetical protein|nr:hypothetical protein [Actinoplanes sp.]